MLHAVLISVAASAMIGVPSPATAVAPQLHSSTPWLAFVFDRGTPPTAIASITREGDLDRLASSDRDEGYPCDPGDVASVHSPRWSPDGSMLSFVRWVVTSDVGCGDEIQMESQLVAMEADGSHERVLAASLPGISQAGWSPDGSSIYYTIGSPQGLWSVAVDGGDPEQVNEVQGWQQVSPSGGRVAIVSSDLSLDQTLSVAAIDGSDASDLGPIGPHAYAELLRWSPDEEWIAAVRDEPSSDEPSRIVLIPSDGSDRDVVWRGKNVSWSNGIDVSPSGGKLIFARARSGLDLWILDLATGSVRNVTQTELRREGEPAWRPSS